ncbi:AAA family ATPase [Kribbella sp. VKM Ac-2568]|uniref:AAA family ATPase n=1 Tax=Kribbella sp. VKM Ac-2568 TaxID=2512219 RepID=UPI00105299BA|nr:AAA family ATPase [Kribbella sp. VKM Ac-2568]TCM48977.1 pilus assembly protein CpaE [Kribbella sp. VKM Ac-2568]
MTILCQPAAAPHDLISNLGGDVRSVDDLDAALRALNHDPAEDLVVVGPEADAGDALRFAAELRLERPATGLILVREHVDVALLTEALRAGVREVVAAGDTVALVAACERSRTLSGRVRVNDEPEPVHQGKIVTVFAAKGGCGKTTIAINLAAALSAGDGNRVCLVDLDLSFGDVAISVQLDPVRTISDALPMAGHLDTTGAVSLLTSYRPGLDMLLAPVTPGDAEKIPAALVGELLTVLRGMFDFVVVDTPAQFSEHVLTAMDVSDHHVLLTTPDTPALKNLRITLDMLDLLSYSRDIRSVVLNRSDSKVGLTSGDVERVVRSAVNGHVPSSRNVPISINKGTPIVIATPAHPVSQAITRFAHERLLNRPVAARSRAFARRAAGRRS